ncbi:MAG: hypothetical protein WB689_23945 [Xanthobacteraceae bacterium]
MAKIRPEVTGRTPLAVTFDAASQITGLGLTTLWKFAKEGRIRLIRPPAVRRTLIDYSSLKRLLFPEQIETQTDTPASQHHRQSRKLQTKETTP